MMMSSTSKKTKTKPSQILTSINNPHQNCEEKGNDHNLVVSVPYLPTHDIIIEILSRVRIKTLFNCRLVCKTWAALISTPQFAQLHLSRSPTSCLIKLLKEKHNSKTLHLIDLEYPNTQTDKLVFLPKINLPDVPLGFINSCNGLVCLGQFIEGDHLVACNIFVCNPVLREYTSLPNVAKFDIYSCAFGFSHITNQYKVVLSSYEGSNNYRTQIYTLGEGCWRDLGTSFYYIWNNNFNAYLYGALHWISFRPPCPYICCFDFNSEQYRVVPEPSEYDKLNNDYDSAKMHVGVINGNLSICSYDYDFDIRGYVVIWVMKDYGVKESWMKDYIITDTIDKTPWDIYEPIVIKGNGEILVKFNNDSIWLYDPELGAFKSKLKIFGVRSEFHAIGHVPTLISLKDVAKGENLKVLV